MTEPEVTQIIQELQAISRKVDGIYQGLYGITGTAEKGFCGRLVSVENTQKKMIVILSVAVGSGGLGAILAKVIGG